MSTAAKTFVNGVLLLYHRPVLRKDAATVWEHIEAFERHSAFKVRSVNTQCGFPARLKQFRFSVVVLHYSLFGGGIYYLTEPFYEYLAESSSSYKIAFFQDEYRYCRRRFEFLNRYKIDCVYTLVEPRYFPDTYGKYTSVPKLIHYLPGYVSEGLLDAARRFARPDAKRTIDVGYRGRRLEYYMGKGAQEKCAIAEGFLTRAAKTTLVCDIACEEHRRIYGDDWYRFLGSCRAVLGVEAGVSVFDLEDTVRIECERLLEADHTLTFDEIHDRVLTPWEGRIPYRTISPRHFEAAALRACQILFEGAYSGIMRPMEHYLPLNKDFSNFDDVLRLLRDNAVRREVTERAYRDLIASGKYSYRAFIAGFDRELQQAGFQPGGKETGEKVTRLLRRGLLTRKACAVLVELGLPAHVPDRLRKPLKPFLGRWWRRVFGFNEEGPSPTP